MALRWEARPNPGGVAVTDFAGRVAIITGAGKGLGRAYALALGARAAAVIVNNRRHPGERDEDTSAFKVAAAIQAAGGRAIPHHADVARADAGRSMVEAALAEFGRVDIVIANAAVPQAAQFHKLNAGDFREIFDVAFFGALHVLQAAWPVMQAQGYGRVITTTSSAGRFGNHGLSAYGAAKGAIESLTRTLSAEGARRNIKVNAISPYAMSQMTADYLPRDIAERFGPEHVVPMVLWLASEQCGASGELIIAGGGHFRLGYNVETSSVPGEGTPMGDVYRALTNRPGRPYPSATAAFDSLLCDLGLPQAHAAADANQS
jgi:NAD(P)-dependent dehydrogenase (short-subunit alcohol dehydrogenase family)